jgi:hypothetical protein
LVEEERKEDNGNSKIMELETLFDSKIAAKDSSDDLSAYKLTKTKLHV